MEKLTLLLLIMFLTPNIITAKIRNLRIHHENKDKLLIVDSDSFDKTLVTYGVCDKEISSDVKCNIIREYYSFNKTKYKVSECQVNLTLSNDTGLMEIRIQPLGKHHAFVYWTDNQLVRRMTIVKWKDCKITEVKGMDKIDFTVRDVNPHIVKFHDKIEIMAINSDLTVDKITIDSEGETIYKPKWFDMKEFFGDTKLIPITTSSDLDKYLLLQTKHLQNQTIHTDYVRVSYLYKDGAIQNVFNGYYRSNLTNPMHSENLIYTTANGYVRVCFKKGENFSCKQLTFNPGDKINGDVKEYTSNKNSVDSAIHSLYDGRRFLLSMGVCSDHNCVGNDNIYFIRLLDSNEYNGLNLKIDLQIVKPSCDIDKYVAMSKFFEHEDEYCLASSCIETYTNRKKPTEFSLDVTCFNLQDFETLPWQWWKHGFNSLNDSSVASES